MLRKSYKPEEIVAKVRQVDMLTSRSEMPGVIRSIGRCSRARSVYRDDHVGPGVEHGGAMPARRRRSEHQEDRSGDRQHNSSTRLSRAGGADRSQTLRTTRNRAILPKRDSAKMSEFVGILDPLAYQR